ncbi:hypothetical protein J6590_081231, partial [Homalodisca vitripennis]
MFGHCNVKGQQGKQVADYASICLSIWLTHLQYLGLYAHLLYGRRVGSSCAVT